jgi:hypothetical protein
MVGGQEWGQLPLPARPRANALGEVAQVIIDLQEIDRRDGDSVGKDDEVQSAGVLGGGILDPGDAG